jgi:hypothetical protein
MLSNLSDVYQHTLLLIFFKPAAKLFVQAGRQILGRVGNTVWGVWGRKQIFNYSESIAKYLKLIQYPLYPVRSKVSRLFSNRQRESKGCKQDRSSLHFSFKGAEPVDINGFYAKRGA